MEEAVRASRDCLIAVHAARANHADRRLRVLHHAALYAARMGAQHDVGMLLHEERILHVACRVVFGEVHGRKHVPIVFHLRSVGHRETEAREDVDDFVFNDRERVARAELNGVRRAREVEVVVGVLFRGERLAQGVEFVLERGFEGIDFLSRLALLLRRHVAEVGHEVVEQAFLA